jgi:hypothetical protein
MELLLRCKVYPGQFSDEYAVSAEQVGGEKFSLFAPARDVVPDEAPTRDRAVDGWLKVAVWDLKGDMAVVRLPRESFESGRFITARSDQFQAWPHAAETSR